MANLDIEEYGSYDLGVQSHFLDRSRQYYLLAILLALLFHGTLMSFTMENTYDAYVHIFFGSHYAESWFELWNQKWYTGFTMTSYPPLVHQIIALLSKLFSLKASFMLWALVIVALFIRGVFHFSRIWVSDLAAGYACLAATFSSSYLEAMHVFGQLPSLTGIALLLNASPELYKWIRYGRGSYFITGLSILACLTAAHHVTTIFGTVFFIAPVLATAVIDLCAEDNGGIEKVRLRHFVNKVIQLLPKAILLGVCILVIVITVIFPYWYWSKTDPITQISIPHGSRASFINEPNLGLVFFLIPWGGMLMLLPGILTKLFRKRNFFLALSFCLLFLLGTGGTTPLPKMILGENAFNILTLDRFTFWGSIMALPFLGAQMHSLIEGRLATVIRRKGGLSIHKALVIFIIGVFLLIAGLTINFSNYKPLQPDPMDVDPIVDFLSRDGHDRWRYLTLGFGDQMAWLSANTAALSVDGNYHSARRLPELTSRAVERIENSKYLGEEGLGALRDIVSLPEKYNLKYIFANDKFYEPLLYFYGWTKLQSLENNIDLWERKDVPPLPTILPKNRVPVTHQLMWGILPVSTLIICLILNACFWFLRKEDRVIMSVPIKSVHQSDNYIVQSLWFIVVLAGALFFVIQIYKNDKVQHDVAELLPAYFHALDFKKQRDAYAYLDKGNRLTYEQYVLENSLEDGILASYSKLDTLIIKELNEKSKTHITASVQAKWFTAIQKYDTHHKIDLIKRGEKWLIKKEPKELATPPNQFINIPDINFHDQGRRKAEVDATYKEDILDRPECYIHEANLIKKNNRYHLVGDIQNIDNVPAYITIEGRLIADDGTLVSLANADEVLIHNLLPKEKSVFRIDFDMQSDSLMKLNNGAHPKFQVLARSTVTDEKLYKFTGLRKISASNSTLSGWYDNYGNQEISIPQILIEYNKSDELMWTSAHYIDKGIRPQREKRFNIDLNEAADALLITRGNDNNLLINGISRSTSSKLLQRKDYTQNINSVVSGNKRFKLYQNGLTAKP